MVGFGPPPARAAATNGDLAATPRPASVHRQTESTALAAHPLVETVGIEPMTPGHPIRGSELEPEVYDGSRRGIAAGGVTAETPEMPAFLHLSRPRR
jgi:hypothetical protein